MDLAANWKARLQPLTGARWPLRCGHEFSADELARLRDGLWPRDMDDRWAVWLDGDTLRCWRSWTGTCIYEAQITIGDGGLGTAAVLDVLDNPEFYHRASTDTAELERFEGVLSLVRRREDDGDALAGVSIMQVG